MNKEKVINFLDNIFKYFAIPLVIILFLSLFSKLFEGKVLGNISGWVSVGLFVAWVGMIVYKSFAKRYGPKTIRWLLIVALTPLILSVMLALLQRSDASNYCFVIGAVFFEVYAVGDIVYSIMGHVDKIINIILMSIVFIVLGYVTIYFSAYGYEENTIFNSLIAVFSAIIGGSLMLGGVAWTIKKSDQARKEEEKEKAKPYLKNYLKSYYQDQDVKIEFLDFNKNDNLESQGFVLYLQNISDSILFVTDLIIHGQVFSVNNIVLEKNGKIQLNIFYYTENLKILKNVQIIGHDILNNYYSFGIDAENICEQYEEVQIGMPKDVNYNEIKDIKN